MSELVPVKSVNVVMSTPYEVVVNNINAAAALPIQNVHDLAEWRAYRVIALVGGGASLKDTLPELNKYNTIFACGSVHDYLIDNDINVNYCVICDPDPLVLGYLKNANNSCTYLIASQTDPSVFSYLRAKGCKVAKWHCAGDEKDNHIFGENPVLIGGGCTVGTRTISIAINFGFRHLHMFGFDTCIHEDKSHAYSFNDPEAEKLKQVTDVTIGDRQFKMAGYMLGQFLDFQKVLLAHSDIEFKFFGDGALKYLLDYAAKITTKE